MEAYQPTGLSGIGVYLFQVATLEPVFGAIRRGLFLLSSVEKLPTVRTEPSPVLPGVTHRSLPVRLWDPSLCLGSRHRCRHRGRSTDLVHLSLTGARVCVHMCVCMCAHAHTIVREYANSGTFHFTVRCMQEQLYNGLPFG